MRRCWILAGWVAVAASCGPAPSPELRSSPSPGAREVVAEPAIPEPPPLDEALLRRHTAALSDDAMQGRRPGTEGGARAVAYIEAQMQALGLEPAGEDGGWTQAVPIRAVRLDPSRSSLALRRAGAQLRPLLPGAQIVAGRMGPAGTHAVRAPLVFVGYGITAPEYGWDDYGDADLRGAVAVVLVGDPPVDDDRFEGPALTYYGRWTYKLERARRAGAAGCLIVHETEAASYDWEVVRSSWAGEQFALGSRDDEAPASLEVQGWIHRALAEELAAAGGRDLAGWHALAQLPDARPLRLGVELVATLVTTETSLSDVNVLGRIPGRTRPGEHVVVTAHWDHLGIDPEAPPGQDAIFNGAVDNASGVAGLLGLAAGLQARVRQGRGPGRSVLLVATTAEEQGLLGSRYHAAHPGVPRGSIVAAANLDSMNVHGRTTTIEVTGRGRSTLEDVLEQVAAEQGRTVVGEARPEAGGYFRSDHFSYAERGVPAIDFRGGPTLEQGGRAAGEALARQRARRYHTVDDEYDDSWPFTGTLQDVQALEALVMRVADEPSRPRWKPGHEPVDGG